MLIVMVVISVLLILIIPNVMKHQATIQTKGCQAYQKNVQAQVQAYMLEKNDGKIPTIGELHEGNYITETKCANGDNLIVNGDGTVSVEE